MSRTKIAILISIIVLSSGLFVYFNTHQQSFTPTVILMATPSYQPTINEVKLDSSMASQLLDPTKPASKK